ncbi:CsoS2 family carboxysome shell protein, partial [Thioalkalicoccus limnaeus]
DDAARGRASIDVDTRPPCGCGCGGRDRATASTPPTAGRPKGTDRSSPIPGTLRRTNGKRAPVANKPTGRLLALARRAAQSGRGKAAIKAPATTASLARQVNPKLTGRELAQTVRAQRSRNGSVGTTKPQPTGRQRPARANPVGAAEDQPWKVGSSETSHGQRITGTRVGRGRAVTGNEPSTCRSITGTEYLGAEIFREFCLAEPPRGPEKVRTTRTGAGNRVTGNEVGRSPRVTGDEPGTCQSVTGTEYLSAEQYQQYCQTEPPPNPRLTARSQTVGGHTVSGAPVGPSAKVTGHDQGARVRPTGSQYLDPSATDTAAVGNPVPAKVGVSQTLAGRGITGTLVGRNARVTGDEPGTCRLITGDEYVGGEQYEAFCQTRPAPLEAPKVGRSTTARGQRVSGTQTGRSERVTGDEPGTCQIVTGTPYAGLEQATEYCAVDRQQAIQARVKPLSSVPIRPMTGQGPGVDGVVTGAGRGACEPVTGTPYVGAEQLAGTCDGYAAPGEADFPQALDGAAWQSFSVQPPARAAQRTRQTGAVTGTRYEQGGRITGPFDQGSGKVTGTEEFRFDRGAAPTDLLTMEPAAADSADAVPPPPRVTGEGQAAGTKITGDDWERGERVTGTEGRSARRRNPTRPGPMNAMTPVKPKRNEELPAPVSRVTGSSGNTDRGSLITYSGGARG